MIGRHAFSHRLRTLDALQLAVAIDFTSQGLSDCFVVADKLLAEIAVREGLNVNIPKAA